MTWRGSSTTSRRGAATPLGEQGTAAKWAHAAMALAIRALGRGASDGAAPDPAAVLTMVERVMREGDARSGHTEHRACGPTTPARCCAPGWTRSSSTSRRASCSPSCSATDFFHADL